MKLDRPTYAEINLDAVEQNVSQIRRLISPRTKIMGIVKANAYGHGAPEISKAAIKGRVDALGVASIGEAVELREAGLDIPILILSEPPADVVDIIIKYKLTQTIYTYRVASALSKAAKKLKATVPVHIKIDTGMGRVGILCSEALDLMKNMWKLDNLFFEGIFTHFSQAENLQDDYTKKQISLFQQVLIEAENCGKKFKLKHAANSAGTFFWPKAHLDLVRIGLGLYGIYPEGVKKNKKKEINLQPALEFKTKVIYLKRVPAGSRLGYGGTYTTQKETWIATLPVGYADGLNRSLSNLGAVLIRGKRFPIVGKISMDLTLVDVGNFSLEVGDEVVLIGSQGNERISVEEVAALQKAITYEIVCGIGKRVPRIYL